MGILLPHVLPILQALIDIERDVNAEVNPIEFAQHCATTKEVRDASVEASKKMNDFSVEIRMRKDIFDNLVTFKERIGLEGLKGEQRRFVEKSILAGKRNGLHLDEKVRDEVKAVKKRISDLSTDYLNHLNEDMSYVELSKEELDGVPEDLVASLEKAPKDEKKLKVTMKYPHYFPVMKKCKVPETRKKVSTTYNSK